MTKFSETLQYIRVSVHKIMLDSVNINACYSEVCNALGHSVHVICVLHTAVLVHF